MDFLPQPLQTVILILQNFLVLTKSGWKTWSVEMSSKLLNLNTGKKCVKNTLRSQTGLRFNVMYGEQNFLQAGIRVVFYRFIAYMQASHLAHQEQ